MPKWWSWWRGWTSPLLSLTLLRQATLWGLLSLILWEKVAHNPYSGFSRSLQWWKRVLVNCWGWKTNFHLLSPTWPGKVEIRYKGWWKKLWNQFSGCLEGRQEVSTLTSYLAGWKKCFPQYSRCWNKSSEEYLLCSFGLSTINGDLDRSTLSSATQQQPLLSVFVSQSSSGCYFSTSCCELSSCDMREPTCHATYNQPAQLVRDGTTDPRIDQNRHRQS